MSLKGFGCSKVLGSHSWCELWWCFCGWESCLAIHCFFSYLVIIYVPAIVFCPNEVVFATYSSDEQLTCKKISLCVGSSMQLNCYAWLLSTHCCPKYVLPRLFCWVNEIVKMDIMYSLWPLNLVYCPSSFRSVSLNIGWHWCYHNECLIEV